MGYGITFKTKEGRFLTREEVKSCVEAIQGIINQNKEIIKVEFKNKESYNKYNINFNGYNKDAHETFAFYSKFKDNPAEEIIEALDDEKSRDYDEVITARGILKRSNMLTSRKPYDKIVKQALMRCQQITNNGFDIVCDDNYTYYKNRITQKQGAVEYIKKGKKTITYKTLDEVGKINKYSWSK